MSTTTISRLDHWRHDTQITPVEPGTDSPQANVGTTPKSGAPAGAILPEPAISAATPKEGSSVREPTWDGSAAATMPVPIPRRCPSLADPFLALASDVLDDAERTRIANENRLRQLTRTGLDKDGKNRGLGMNESHPDVARLAALVDMLDKIEHQAALNLARLLRQHPLGPWVKAQKGVGDKQAARLLAIVGDPYINELAGQPRTVSQLWAYCGHGDPARRLRKGMTQAELFTLGNPEAKKRTWLIACAILKAQGPLSETYYKRKAFTEGRTHLADCRRCGPAGHPALIGSPLSDAHRHADALRVTGKEFLKLLWREAKCIHETGELS